MLKPRGPERLQMAAYTDERALKKPREAQERQGKEKKAEKICKFTGAEPGESLQIIQTWILELMGLCRWWQPCVSS